MASDVISRPLTQIPLHPRFEDEVISMWISAYPYLFKTQVVTFGI